MMHNMVTGARVKVQRGAGRGGVRSASNLDLQQRLQQSRKKPNPPPLSLQGKRSFLDLYLQDLRATPTDSPVV